MGRAVDGSVRAAGQGGRDGRFQARRAPEGDEVVRFQVGRPAGLRDGLGVHDHSVKVGHDVDVRRVVGVGQDRDADRVPARSAIGGRDGHSAHGRGRLRAAGIDAVDQKGPGAFQGFADQKNVGRRGIIAEDGQGGLVEVLGVDGKDLVFRSPVQFQGKGRDPARPHFDDASQADEVDIRAGKDLVLCGKSSATDRHDLHLPF